MNLAGSNVVVVGLGRSGIAASALCLRHGAHVTATDTRTEDAMPEVAASLRRLGVSLALGGHSNAGLDQADLIVVSPGVPNFEELLNAERKGIPVIGELELACRFTLAPIVLIGGTNGKSTVTSWTGDMLSRHAGWKVFVGGNLGVPFAECVHETFDRVVLEISSFQAERIPTLHAHAAALLNITEDHLDRYDGLQAYAGAKGNMFVNMTASDLAVIPVGDEMCERQACRGHARTVTFGPGGDIAPEGPWLVDHVNSQRYPLESIRLSGHHNVLNACSSVALAAAVGATPAEIAESLANFSSLPHRTVFVRDLGGVHFYDDSKGTNVGATVTALQGMTEPRTVLIAGGRDKLGSYDSLVEVLAHKGRALVLIGEAADRIAQAAQGRIEIARASTMADAVATAYQLAKPGDAVLLSPACASFDMFRSYAHRGEVFCECVGLLTAKTAAGERG